MSQITQAKHIYPITQEKMARKSGPMQGTPATCMVGVPNIYIYRAESVAAQRHEPDPQQAGDGERNRGDRGGRRTFLDVEYTMQYDKYTLTKELGAKGVPVGPVLDWNELENDPDLNEDGTLITIDQGDARGKFKTIGLPFTMSNYAPDYQRAPKLGENNEEILKSLGYTGEQIADLATKGVIGSNDGVKADLTAAPAAQA